MLLKETTSLLGLRHAGRNPLYHCSRLLSISDNLSSLFSFEKRRSSNRGLLMLCRRATAHVIACAFLWRMRYIESSRKPTDGDFRLADAGKILPGVCQRAPSFAAALVEQSLFDSPEFFIEAATQQFPFCVPLDATELPTPTVFGSPPPPPAFPHSSALLSPPLGRPPSLGPPPSPLEPPPLLLSLVVAAEFPCPPPRLGGMSGSAQACFTSTLPKTRSTPPTSRAPVHSSVGRRLDDQPEVGKACKVSA